MRVINMDEKMIGTQIEVDLKIQGQICGFKHETGCDPQVLIETNLPKQFWIDATSDTRIMQQPLTHDGIDKTCLKAEIQEDQVAVIEDGVYKLVRRTNDVMHRKTNPTPLYGML